MVYSPVMGNFRLSGQEAGGQPDYGQALREGFQTSADVYKPKSASESLLAQMLQNKMNIPKAEHAEENERLGRMLQQAHINQANRASSEMTLNPFEKAQLQIQTKSDIFKQQQDLKKQQELEEQAKHFSSTYNDVEGIDQYLQTGEGTGFFPSIMNSINAGGEGLGGFNEKATRLQADLARLISSRGGSEAAKIAAKGKPSSWSSTEYNKGITKSYKERLRNEFNTANDEYKKITGQNLPYQLPAEKGFVILINDSGKKYKVHSEHVGYFMKKHKGLRRV